MTKTVSKIAIVHPSVSWYRLPLFRALFKKYPSITVLFTQCTILPIYKDQKISIKKPEGFNSKMLPSYKMLPPPYPQEITPSVLVELMNNYDAVLWGDSLTSLEAVIVFSLCKILRKPIILWADEWGMPKPLLRRTLEPIIKSMMLQSSAVIAHGQRHYAYFRSKGIKPDKIVFTGDAGWLFPTDDDYKTAKLISNRFRGKKILFTGGLVMRKGVNYLIQAFGRLIKEQPDLNLWIVGDGPELSTLRTLVIDLQIEERVTFFGWKTHDQIAPYFLAADIFVLPSWDEPWGLVMNEAMSVGKPVITTYGVGSCFDLVKPGINGFIVPPKDSDAIFIALKKILSDEKFMILMGQKSSEIIQDYTYDRMATGFLKAILQALNGAGYKNATSFTVDVPKNK